MNRMIAYCGLDCEKCNAYIATVNDDDALREKTAQLWSELNHVEITPAMINCLGCRSDGVKTPFCDSICEVRKCAMKKDLGSCAHCADMENCETIGFILANSTDALNNLKSLT